jgi:hypothetical protein
MARFARLVGLTRGRNVRLLAHHLLIVGRVAKLLEEAGHDPSKIYYCSGASFQILEWINPTIPLKARDYERLFIQAHTFLRQKFGYAITTPESLEMLTIECFTKMGMSLINYQDRFRELQHTTKNATTANMPITASFLFGKIQQQSLQGDLKSLPCLLSNSPTGSLVGREWLLGLNSSPSQHKKLEELGLVSNDYAVGDLCPFPLYSFKLSEYGKGAVMRYFKEQEESATSWSLKRSASQLTIPITSVDQAQKSCHLGQSRKGFITAIHSSTLDQFDMFLSAFKQHCIQNMEIVFNNLTLPDEVKTLIFEKINIRCAISGLNYVSKVFKALRECEEDLDDEAVVLLTADDQASRTAGLSIQRLVKMIEEMPDEEESSDA